MLSSLKILDFSTLLPGPFATMLLADWGADVLRVEAPHRPDLARINPPFEDGVSAWHALLSRNKKSIALDLKQPDAVEIVKELVKTYDIVLEQFRPGVMDKLGIGYDTLKEINPSLIFCSLTGFGQTGPYKNRAGHDINFLALSGIMSYTGRKADGPPPLGIQIADIGGGSLGAVTGILAAVVHRQHTGEGQRVDISMFDMAVGLSAHIATYYLVGNTLPDRENLFLNGGSYYDFYRTRDGRYLSVGSLEPQFWRGFCHAINRPDLIDDGQNRDPAVQHRVKTEIEHEIARRTLAEWTEIFGALDVCVEPVQTIAETVAHPHTQARHMVVDVPKPNGGSQRQIANPFKFSAGEAQYRHTGGALGADTESVLREMGYSAEKIAQLREKGVFGDS